MKTESDRCPDIVLERFLLGELPRERMEAVRRRLDRDEALRRRLDELRRSDDEVMGTYPAEAMARAIEAKLPDAVAARPRPKPWRPLPVLAAASAAAFALVMFLALPLSRATGAGGLAQEDGLARDSEGIRYKGDARFASPSLALFRLRGDAPEALKDGAAVRPGDVVQVRYNALARRYGAIFSMDGRGQVTLHSPLPRSSGVALEKPEALLPSSFELDDAPDFELFFFVTADAPFDLDAVLEKAGELARSGRASVARRLDLPASFTQTSLILVKENPAP